MWPMLPFLALIFILPFPGTVAFRLLCLLSAFFVAAYAWRRLEVPEFPCKTAIALWAAVASASVLYAVDVPYTLREIKNEVGYSMLAFVSFFAVIRDEQRLRLVCGAVALALATISLAALAGFAWLGEWEASIWYGGAPSTTNFLVTAAPVVVLGAYLSLPRYRSKLVIGAGVLLLAVAILSGQRSVWAAFLVQGLLVSLWLARTRRRALPARTAAVLAFVITMCCAGGLLATETLRTKGNFWGPEAMQHDPRPKVWTQIVQRIVERPLAGAGLGRYAMGKAHRDLIPRDNALFWHAHNVVLNYGLSAGVPGMLAILVLFAALGARFWRLALEPDPTLRAIGLAGTLIVAGVFTRNQFNDFFVRDGALLFWALAGTLFGLALRRERELRAASPGGSCVARTV
jgi:O-antigen ligase